MKRASTKLLLGTVLILALNSCESPSSTHPDEDHIQQLNYLDEKMSIVNFYCVDNEATKEDESDGFKKYKELRDSSKSFKIYRGCKRKWMNEKGKDKNGKFIDSAGLSILWPITENEHYKDALQKVKDGKSPNNISPIINYSLASGVKALWMGDLETKFMENILEAINLPKIDILFAPHHGRDSGKVPIDWLNDLDPKIIIVGEAPSDDLNYYSGYNTITQNSAGDILFECMKGKVHVYVSSDSYSVDYLENENIDSFDGNNYIGTLNL